MPKSPAPIGVPQDWTHHHVVFGGAPPAPDTKAALASEPRYLHQKLRQAAALKQKPAKFHGNKHKVDWSVNLGGSAAFLAPGTYPAKYTFDINASPSCASDFAVFALNVAGSGTQATIVAYNNLYTGTPAGLCAGTAPTVLWAYNTGTAINTSPVLSLNGKKVAWIANANPPVLHVLTIGTGAGNGAAVNSPAVPGVGNNAVDTTVTFGSVGDTRSSLFVDYTNDVGYAASNDGNIHKFTGIFAGTPAEVLGGGWPVLNADGANRVLTSIIYDSVSRNLFYGTDLGTFGYIRETGSTRGVCLTGSPPCRGLFTYNVGVGNPVIDAPLLDVVAQNVFVFVGNDGTGHARVQQTDTQLSSSGPSATLGLNGANLYAGTFDNNYYIAPSSGFLYTCGYAPGAATPTLYRIGFNAAAAMNTATDGSSLLLSNTASQCSPVTEVFNAPTLKDWLFVSVTGGCVGTGGGGAGCVNSLNVTSSFPGAVTQARPAAGGTSGIVVDNISTLGQASSIYFSTQANGTCGDGGSGTGCAVKMTQSGLN